MIPPKELFIVGGGASIKEGLPLGLRDKLKDKFVISLNLTIKIFYSSTFLSFVDCNSFYKKYKEELVRYPLIIGKHNPEIDKIKLPNTILLKTVEKWDRTLKTGVFGSYLTGLFALSLGIYLLDSGTIWILGFDGGVLPNQESDEDVTDKLNIIDKQSCQKSVIQKNGRYYRPVGHFYQGSEIEHRGIGKYSFYTMNDKVNKVFAPFKDETQCKIFNVSPNSNLNIFPKIDYTTMFAKMNNVVYNQDDLRHWVLDKIKEI